MTVKKLIEIDISDAKLREVTAIFAKYEAAVAGMPAKWAAVNAEVGKGAKGFESLAAAILTQTELLARVIRGQRDVTQEVEKQSRAWQGVGKWAKGVATDIETATKFLMRWSPLITGVLGVGGLYGVDRLAAGVGQTRQTALGVGAPYGDVQAFRANFGRLGDPEAFLHGIAGAKLDIQQSIALRALGVSTEGSTTDTGVSALRALFNLADTTDPHLYGQQIAARQLGGITTPEQLQRMRETPRAEREQLFRGFERDRARFSVPPDVQKAWQDLSTQLTRAGTDIENTFVKGLVPLAPAIVKLSSAIDDFLKAALASPKLGEWIKDVAAGFEHLAHFFEGKESLKDFVPPEAMGAIVGGAAGTLIGAPWLGAAVGGGIGHLFGGRAAGPPQPSSVSGGLGLNNPGNLRLPGSSTGFSNYASEYEGVRAIARQLQLYGGRGNDTIAGMISKYAPTSENNTAAYIKSVSEKTGYAAGQHLNLNDPEVLARVVAAIVANEQSRGHYDKYKDTKVVVQILGNTGANPIVSVNGLKD